MNRAERRRREKQSAKKDPVLSVNRGKIREYVREDAGALAKEAYTQGYEQGINDGFSLMLTIPLEVLMDCYWKKSYRERIPGFAKRCVEYYERFRDGELDMEKLRDDLWRYGGVRIGETPDEAEEGIGNAKDKGP